MTGLPKGAEDALTPVREALLAAAEARAEQLRDDAAQRAAAIVASAQEEAVRITSAAASQGEASARSDAALRSARVRRHAQEVVLAQQAALRRELQKQVREAALSVRDDPRYPFLLASLTDRCRAVLGADASVSEDPSGGVVGRAGSRRLDLSLPALAARALDSMGPEVSRLWTP
ncbi:MAG: hypothetical protein ACYC1E_10655 [Propionibacteriaceae bacterium]